MREYSVEGALIQRFVLEIGPTSSAKDCWFCNAVLLHMHNNYKEPNQVFAVMWDVSGKDINMGTIVVVVSR